MLEATMRRQADNRTSPFQEFFRTEAAGGVLLMVCAGLALALANSPWADTYHHVWTMPLTVGGTWPVLAMSLHQWVNEGLMAVFFLLVGLEIKREILAGELASARQAALPVVAALGGMAMPALLYLVAAGGAAARGWAVPIATDIAFALGALALLSPRAPNGLRVFLAALAIVDDVAAVLVIALFYSGNFAFGWLAAACVVFALLLGINFAGVRRLSPYVILGIALWLFVRNSGMHATMAGVLLALTIPTRARIDAAEFSSHARDLLDQFDRTETGDRLVLTSKGQQDAIVSLERAAASATGPLLRLEHALHRFSAFVVMPLFAFANAGVTLNNRPANVVTLAVIVGLVIGKPLGIMGAAFVVVRARLGTLPRAVDWQALHGCAWLGGIGFTMSLFIATLAFEDKATLDSAKIGIVASSVVAATVGGVLLRRATRNVGDSLRHEAIRTP